MSNMPVRWVIFSAFLSLMISVSVRGDDIEIYLGVANDQVTYNPNVLFIMDTSGSMQAKDGGSETRMLRVQNALKSALQSTTNINAGLMRFSDFGGPVLYPIKPIDDPVSPQLISSISAGDHDGSETSSVVTLNGDILNLSNGTSVVYTGLRYDKLNIPQGATVTKAYLRFVSSGVNIGATNISIAAEAADNGLAFSASANNISSRTRTTSTVNWNSANDWPAPGERIDSIDISPVAQEVVNRAGWCGGNGLNLIIQAQGLTASSSRRVPSFEDGSGVSPQLVLEYDQNTATGCISGALSFQVSSQANNAEEKLNGYQSTGSELTFNNYYNTYIGMRFQNISIPKSATITKAYLEFTAYSDRTSSGASLTFSAANEDDADDFSPYTRYMLRDKTKTGSVTWSNIPSWYRNNQYQSPDIKSVLQPIVNRAGWTPGNDMMLIVSSIAGSRGAYTYNGQPSGAVRLVVEYQGNASPGTVAKVRDLLSNKVDELSANGWTPIVDTLYEAVNYYGGRNVDYGLARGTASVSTNVRRSTRVSQRLSYTGADSVLPPQCNKNDLGAVACINETIATGATYLSPVNNKQCQTNNHIVLLSDGEANNNHSVSKIEALLQKSCNSGSSGEKCGLDLVKNISKSDTSVIETRVTTHTIGFAANATANNFLNKIALQSGGGFYTADNSADLVTAFQSILKSVKDVNATFVSPGVAVNQLNRLTHKDELYFALFKPAEGTQWPGNLKKYKINGDEILDKNGVNAVDSNTGFFQDNAHSYWSTLEDGNDVRLGGAVSRLDLVRNIYWFEGNGSIITTANQIHESNSNITTEALGLSGLSNGNTVRTDLLKWTRGVDVTDADGSTTDVRMQMGDPIHSQPVIVNYGANDAAILVATNHGFLHSFDPETGEENFAVMPKSLAGNLYSFYQNSSSYNHIYGLDGDMVLRDTGTSKTLYVGMRRGGRNYYAFDITSKSSPAVKFTIQGGTTGFEKLGQTWSRPTLTKIKIGSSTKNVMIFGGGYDDDQDSKSLRTPDALGNEVYIVDADTGALLWSASNSGATFNHAAMQYSIPARISVIDRESDGLADHLYIADTGGQVFRLDIHNGESLSQLVTGGVLADFSANGSPENFRRFYYGPDVSEISLADEHYYAVAIGSGYRAHPLNSVIQDNFYMIKDKGVFTRDNDGNFTLPAAAYTHNEMYDVTAHLLTSDNESTRSVAAATFANKKGWMIKLATGGEKVLASPLILNYKLLFTTYLPASASDSQCAPPTGNSRAYLVELVNGNALADLNKNNKKEHNDRHATLKQTGIAPETKVLIEDIVKPVVCLGTECTSAVKDLNSDGSEKPCTSAFECLAENLYGRFERVQKNSWRTEKERESP